MIYFVYGANSTRIRKQINKIVKNIFNDEETNVLTFNYLEDDIYSFFDECSSLSLYSESKVVVLENSSFLSNEKTKKKLSDKDENEMIDLLSNELEDTTIIFSLIGSKININSKIYKKILEVGKILELKEISKNEWPQFIDLYFSKKNIKISNDAKRELLIRINYDYDTFINETNKLLLYKSNNITLKDIETIISKPLEENAFNLLNALLTNNKKRVEEIYKDFKILNIPVIRLINLITTSLSFMDKVQCLLNENKTEREIISILKANPYQVSINISNLRKIEYSKIRKAFNDLYEIDKKILHSEVDPSYAFELFLINF